MNKPFRVIIDGMPLPEATTEVESGWSRKPLTRGGGALGIIKKGNEVKCILQK